MVNCCFKNMDQVSFNMPTSNIFVLNGQTVLFQNGTVNSQNVNEELLQEEVFNKESSPKQLFTEVETLPENTYEGGGFVIVKGAQKENDCNLIQLTAQEAADLGIQFSIDNSPKNNSIIDVQNTRNQNVIFQKVGDTLNDIGNESTNAINYLTNESLNDITKMPGVSKGLNEFTILPQYVNGQIAYTLQLPGPDQVHTTQNIGIPITVPTMEVQSVNPAENELNKFVPPVTVKTVINKPSKKTDTSRSGTSLQSYVPNPKVRILSKEKYKELSKNNQQKIVSISKDKYLANRQRKLAPQKILLPPLTKKGKEISSDRKLIRTRIVEYSGPKKQNLSNTKQESTVNQQLLNVNEIKNKGNENNSSKNIKETLSNPSTINGSSSTTTKSEQVQVLTVPQGSQLPKKIIYNLPNDNKPGRKLTPSQLMQIANVLQKNRLNRPSGISNSSTLYDLETNTRIICRVLYPEDFTPEVEKAPVVTNTKKRGRPNKKEQEERPEKEKVEKGTDRVPARTRSGRVTRPPRHFFEDYKRLTGDDYDESFSDYHSGTDENIENSPAVNLLPGLNLHQKRNFSSQFRCPTCNKVYLGRVRMALHFTKYPDHCDSKRLELLKEAAAASEDFESRTRDGGKSTWRKGLVSPKGKGKAQRKMLGRLSLDKVLDSYSENEVKRTCGRRVASMLSTWEMLLLRLETKHNEGKCKVQVFLDELESFVKSVRAVSQQILCPPNCEQPNIQLADDTITSLLGIEKGWYSSNDCGFPQALVKETNPPKPQNQQYNDDDCTATSIMETSQSLLCKDEQDVVKVKEELSDLDLLCVQDDPIGVDSVDQIVSERLKTMAPVDDLVSTLPAMPASSTDELVRGLLTDDLINSLETLIPPTQPPDLDFTVLSTEFSTSR